MLSAVSTFTRQKMSSNDSETKEMSDTEESDHSYSPVREVIFYLMLVFRISRAKLRERKAMRRRQI